MKLIEPSFEIISPTPATREVGIRVMQRIESIARVSHRAEDRQTATTWERFIKAVVVEKGDWSVVEHVALAVRFRVDRGVSHELVRHRHLSYTQESTRFVNGRKAYPEGLEFIRPLKLTSDLSYDPVNARDDFEEACLAAEDHYFRMIGRKARPQEARSVLPNALATTIVVSGNLRAWRHLLRMRTTIETHPDFRRVTIPLLDALQKFIPLLFDDITPNQSQAYNLRLAC